MSNNTQTAEPILDTPLSQETPNTNITINPTMPIMREPEKDLVSHDQVVGLYNEVLDVCRKDRNETQDIIEKFIDLVINEGDASSSSKEALVNLIKAKNEQTSNMSRMVEMLVRARMRDKEYPAFIPQQNNINIKTSKGSTRRAVLDRLFAKEQPKEENKEQKNDGH